MVLFVFMSLYSQTLLSQCPSNQISGSVFLDTNIDGSYDTSENGESNILVRVYDNNGSLVATSTTDNSGNYSISNLAAGDYRVEVVYSQSFQSTKIGINHKSDIRYISTPNCTVDFGLTRSGSQCSENPDILVTCFVRGKSSEFTNYATIVGLEHDFDPNSSVGVYATKQETGSIWGMSHRAGSGEVYSSAFVKQYSSLTTHGHDAIFKTDLNSGTTSLFVKLSNLGINTGSLAVTNESDCAYGAQVGKYGIGNITVSQDESALYAINIFDNTLVKIPFANPSSNNVTSYQIPDPQCTGGVARSFALELHNGRYFVGVTCDGSISQNQNDSEFYVYEFDAITGNFSQIFQTNYTKGYWQDSPADAFNTSQWLTDIDFSDEGNMLLAVSDRFGHRYCNAATSGRVDQQFPDLLVAWNNNGTWTLESNGTAGNLSGTGIGNSEGPGGGEFFGNDFFPGNPSFHSETALGSILSLPGSGEVITTVYDPLFDTYSGGLHRYRTNNGSMVNLKELYSHNVTEYFGKATGLVRLFLFVPSLLLKSGITFG